MVSVVVKQSIILPHACEQIDLSKITVPEGWKLRGNSNWQKENIVGKVAYLAVQDGNRITVRRDIVIARDILLADKEPELKYFIAWMEEAYYQSIGITRGGKP